ALGRLVVWLGSLPPKLAPAFAVVSTVIFLTGLALEERLVLQTDPVQWVNQDTQVIRDIDTIESEVGSSSELGIFVEADDVFADDTVAFVHDFIYDSLERYPGTEMEGGLLTASSIVSTV